MKTMITALCLILSIQLSAQKNKIYELTRSMAITSYDVLKPNDTTGVKVTAQKGWKFVEDHKIKGGIVFSFLEWDNNDTKNDSFYADYKTVDRRFLGIKTKEIKEEEQLKLFFLSDTNIKRFTKVVEKKEPKKSFVTGALTIPIKVRPGGTALDGDGNRIRPFDFTGEVNIGLSVGLRLAIKGTDNKLFVIPSLGLNLTSVSIDENTVQNDIISSSTNASSLSPFIGGVLEYDGLQLLLMIGWDHLSGRIGENWVYQGKPWYGLGVGFNIFNTKAGKPQNKDD